MRAGYEWTRSRRRPQTRSVSETTIPSRPRGAAHSAVMSVQDDTPCGGTGLRAGPRLGRTSGLRSLVVGDPGQVSLRL
jgi:hypothetical protein